MEVVFPSGSSAVAPPLLLLLLLASSSAARGHILFPVRSPAPVSVATNSDRVDVEEGKMTEFALSSPKLVLFARAPAPRKGRTDGGRGLELFELRDSLSDSGRAVSESERFMMSLKGSPVLERRGIRL